jgi:chromosome segregation ATPase
MKKTYYKLFNLLYAEDDNEEQNNEEQNNENENENENTTSKLKNFTQDEVNKMLANDRRKHEEKLKKTIEDLETLKKSKSLSEQEKASLTSRIEELQTQIMTKEQLAEKDKQKIEKDYKKQIEQLSSERDAWKSRHDNTLIVNAIQKAAAEHGAFDIGQIVALVRADDPRVAEELDENGESKGIYTPRVKIVDYDDKQKKEVTLDLTITEAVKRMKEKPENFNLFKDTSQGGLGLDSGTGRSDVNSPPLNDPAAYRRWRKNNLQSGAV